MATLSKVRNGNVTSSECWKLMSNGRTKGQPGEPYHTYIREKRYERKLKRSLHSRVFDRAMSWGSFVEGIAFEKLPLSYTICSRDTIVHPEYPWWVGTPDIVSEDAVGDIKCPYGLRSFCLLSECKTVDELRAVVSGSFKMGEAYFYQLVSNAILTGKRYAELAVYVPYFNDLVAIQERAALADDEYKWIFNADHETLPYLHRDGEYKDLNIIRFDAEPYKAALTERVVMAGQELDESNVTEQLKKSVAV